MPNNQSRVILFTHSGTSIWLKIVESCKSHFAEKGPSIKTDKGIAWDTEKVRTRLSLDAIEDDADRREAISDFVFYKCHNLRIAVAILEANFYFKDCDIPTFGLPLYNGCKNTNFILFAGNANCVMAVNGLKCQARHNNFVAIEKGRRSPEGRGIGDEVKARWNSRAEPNTDFPNLGEIYSNPESLKYYEVKQKRLAQKNMATPWEGPQSN